MSDAGNILTRDNSLAVSHQMEFVRTAAHGRAGRDGRSAGMLLKKAEQKVFVGVVVLLPAPYRSKLFVTFRSTLAKARASGVSAHPPGTYFIILIRPNYFR